MSAGGRDPLASAGSSRAKQTEGEPARAALQVAGKLILAAGSFALAGTSSFDPNQGWELSDNPLFQGTTSACGWGLSEEPFEARALRTETTQAAISSLRRLSGLTWEQLAELFEVSRRSVHFWASGQALSAGNEARLRQVLAVVRATDRGDAASNRAALLEVHGRSRAFDLLREQRFEEARQLLGAGAGRGTDELPKLSNTAQAERTPLSPEVLVDADDEVVHRDPVQDHRHRTKRGKRRGGS